MGKTTAKVEHRAFIAQGYARFEYGTWFLSENSHEIQMPLRFVPIA